MTPPQAAQRQKPNESSPTFACLGIIASLIAVALLVYAATGGAFGGKFALSSRFTPEERTTCFEQLPQFVYLKTIEQDLRNGKLDVVAPAILKTITEHSSFSEADKTGTLQSIRFGFNHHLNWAFYKGGHYDGQQKCQIYLNNGFYFAIDYHDGKWHIVDLRTKG